MVLRRVSALPHSILDKSDAVSFELEAAEFAFLGENVLNVVRVWSGLALPLCLFNDVVGESVTWAFAKVRLMFGVEQVAEDIVLCRRDPLLSFYSFVDVSLLGALVDSRVDDVLLRHLSER